MEDTIYRQQAIDALCNDYCGGHQDCKYYPNCENLKSIERLPSAQPERDVGTCDECIHKDRFDYEPPCKMCIRIASKGRDGDYFCKEGDDDEK